MDNGSSTAVVMAPSKSGSRYTGPGCKIARGGPFDTPEFGSWQREPGSQNYSYRDFAYLYESNGTFLGPLVHTANVELTSANSFVYSSRIQIVDANGDLINARCGRGTATRFE